MGDLFDGYGSTLAPRKTSSGVPAFDEMFGHPPIRVRPPSPARPTASCIRRSRG